MADVLFFEGTARIMRVLPNGNWLKLEPNDHEKPAKVAQAVIKAGADLYRREGRGPDLSKKQQSHEWKENDPAQWEPDPDEDGRLIPIFARNDYRYYLQITKILENVPLKGQVSIAMSIYGFEQDVEWPNPGSRWVCLERVTPRNHFREYFIGNVLDQGSGEIVGTLSACRISDVLRRATVAIHRVNGVRSFPGDKLPEEARVGTDAREAWATAFRQAGWSLDLQIKPRADLRARGGKLWTIGELQQALYAMRLRQMADARTKRIIARLEESKPLERMTQQEIQEEIPGLATLPDPLDKKWLYHLLCVPQIDGFDRGVMFDTYGSDSENLPREGAAIAAEWKFGQDAETLLKVDPSETAQAQEIKRKWAPEDGNEVQDVSRAYFRIGVHEIGHAMGLDHNFKDHGFMNTTDCIAEDELTDAKSTFNSNLQALQLANIRGKNGQLRKDAERLGITPGDVKTVPQFPSFVELHFQADDLNRLRFGPDVTVRPGTNFHDGGPLSGDAQPQAADGLALEASPLLESVPFGAPVRIKLTIRNTSSQQQRVPLSLGLKTGVTNGSVIDPGGNERTFWPLKRAEDSDPGSDLAPDETRTYTMTLLRGAQKALFPMVGHHRVRVTATWQRGIQPVSLEHEAIVRVTAPGDDNHQTAALKVLSTPDTLLSLALVGDQFKEGMDAILAAMEIPALQSHFAVIQAKLLLSGPNNPDPDLACDLIDDSAVMSFDEIESICDLLEKRYKPGSGLNAAKLHNAVLCLQRRIRALSLEGSIEADRAERASKQLDQVVEPWLPELSRQAAECDEVTSSAVVRAARRAWAQEREASANAKPRHKFRNDKGRLGKPRSHKPLHKKHA
jgi:hypothetical protein